VAALEDHGAVTDDAMDPLAAAGSDDAPLAPTYEPDGMAQLESVDNEPDAAAEVAFAAGQESVDALSGAASAANLTDTAAGISCLPSIAQCCQQFECS
jgi:hypothetical protein